MSMSIRAMGPGAGWRWLMQGVNLGRNNPKAIFGGAALLLVSVLVLALGLTLLVGALQAVFTPGVGGSMALSLLVMVPILLVMAGLMVGYLRLIDAVENGRPAGPTDIFAAFRDVPTSLRAIGFVILLAIVQNVLIVGLIMWLAGDVLSWYMQTMQASMAGTPPAAMANIPDGFGIAFVLVLVIGLFGYAVQAIGLGQIALRQSSVPGALTDGISGAAKNLLPMLVLVLLVIAASIVLALLAALLIMLIGVLAKLVGAWLFVVVGVPLYIAVLIAVYVVMFGVMYSIWRDICGDEPAPRNDAVIA